jgi:hypothetical protein
MTWYEIIRCIGILVGPTFALVCGGLVAWIIRVERKLTRIESLCERAYALYEHNIPELHEHRIAMERRLAAIEKRLSVYQIQAGPTHVAAPAEKGTAV